LTQLYIRMNTSLTCIEADASQLLGEANQINSVTKDATQTLSGSCL